MRASTPTDAARRVVPDVAEQLALIGSCAPAPAGACGRIDREISWLSADRSPALANPLREIERRRNWSWR